METERLKTCLASGYERLRDVAADGDLTANVPSCPQWSLADLVSHVAQVYLHKVETMRRGGWPKPWPPEPTGESPVRRLERAYGELSAEFASRSPAEHAVTWHDTDQTVGFWLRRMAHETVIHRIDAELAAGVRSQPVADDLALDGIDEVLQIFLGWQSAKWPEDFLPVIKGEAGGSATIVAGDRWWRLSWQPDGVVTVEPGSGHRQADPTGAELSAPPDVVLRWLWRRGDAPVSVNGDQAAADQLREFLGPATQ